MFVALKDLSNSEKAVFCLMLIIAASVFVCLGKMTVDAWVSYTEIIAGIYVGGKSIQGAADAVAMRGLGKNGVAEKPIPIEPAKPKK